jgi:hypothetical protein
MTRGVYARLLPTALVMSAIRLTTTVARAATVRPNAIDRRVDGLPAHLLLMQPAAALVDAERQIAAVRLVHWYLPGWFLAVLLPAFALAYYWQSGQAAAWRDTLRRRLRNETLVRFTFGATLGLIVRAAALLPSLYLYRVERVMSQNDQLLRAWGLDYILITIAWMVVVGAVVCAVLWLVDRTHQWYLYTIAGILAVYFAVAYLAPYANLPLFDRIVPAPPRAAAIATGIESRANLSLPVVEQIHSRSHLGTAYVSGLGPSRRIVIGDVTIRVSDPGELQYVVARELGYVSAGATWKMALTGALLFIFATAIAVFTADRIGFRRDDDPVCRLALVGAMLSVLYVVAIPIQDSISRGLSERADQFAMALHVDRASAVRTVVRETDQRLVEVCPDVMARLFMGAVQDPSGRVSAINGVAPACPR